MSDRNSEEDKQRRRDTIKEILAGRDLQEVSEQTGISFQQLNAMQLGYAAPEDYVIDAIRRAIGG